MHTHHGIYPFVCARVAQILQIEICAHARMACKCIHSLVQEDEEDQIQSNSGATEASKMLSIHEEGYSDQETRVDACAGGEEGNGEGGGRAGQHKLVKSSSLSERRGKKSGPKLSLSKVPTAECGHLINSNTSFATMQRNRSGSVRVRVHINVCVSVSVPVCVCLCVCVCVYTCVRECVAAQTLAPQHACAASRVMRSQL